MLNNITISRYVETNSIIHKLNALIKLICLVLFIAISLITNNLYVHLIFIVYIIILIFLSKIKITEYLKSLKYVLFLIIGIFIINLIFKVSIYENIVNVLKVIEIIIYSTLLTLTTNEFKMLNAIEIIFSPLKLFKINTKILSLLFSLTIRFIPIIIDTVNLIIKSLVSKGINIKKNRLLILKAIIIPTFNLSIKKADNLAESYEVRLYDLNKKNKLIFEKIKMFDILILICHLLVLIGVILCDI